jgi:hypothetical protein
LKINTAFSRIPRLAKHIVAATLILVFCSPISGITQTAVENPGNGIEQSRRHLLLITKKRLTLQREIDELFKQSTSKITSEKINKLQSQLNLLELDFKSRVTTLPLEDPSLEKMKKLDWVEEIQELTKPLLTAIRDLTEKPRQIQELKSKIEDLETKLQRHQQASESISGLAEDLKNNPLPDTPEGKKFQATIIHLRDEYDPELVQFNLAEARASLDKFLNADESVVETATKTIKEFFQTRGRNLLVTVLTFAGFWWVLSRLRRWILTRKFLTNRTSSIGKLFSAAYNVVVLLFCMFVGLACLYFFNDWLLITLIVMGIFFVLWTSRQWIPQFFDEIKLIVDLGTVREGQRLIWEGVPWLVKEIRLHATLVNDRLQGGEIILPLYRLIDMNSRPVVENEPWFPTRLHDWVLLGDEFYGKIEYQTMEQVVINLKEGGALKYYKTEDFLAQNPVNISNGFEYSIEFGLDYEIQSRICDEIPVLFTTEIKRHLQLHFEGDDPNFYQLEVLLDNAGASSLNLVVEVYVHGRCAHLYEECRREIITTLVRICNEHNLGIPFNQLTVHLPGQNSGSEKLLPPPQAQPGRD